MPSTETRLLALVGDLVGLLSLADLREGLLDALPRAIPSDYVAITELGPSETDIISIARPEVEPAIVDLFLRHAHENPLVRHFTTNQDPRPLRFSDVATRDELEATTLYREVYTPLGVRHQLAFRLPATPGRLIGIALSRGEPDFSDADVELTDRARPFLVQVYRNAIAYSAATDALAGATARQVHVLTGAGLTGREAEVLSEASAGRSDREIAAALQIGERTVQKHLQRAFAKLGVGSRSAAAVRARQMVEEAIDDLSAPPLDEW